MPLEKQLNKKPQYHLHLSVLLPSDREGYFFQAVSECFFLHFACMPEALNPFYPTD